MRDNEEITIMGRVLVLISYKNGTAINQKGRQWEI